VLAVIALSPMAEARPKIDVVVMKNGDRYTCEIVELSQGQLKIKTDNTTGTVLVDWEKVDRLDSPQFFAAELSDGRDLAGLIQKFPAASGVRENFRITSGNVVVDVAARDVVVIARSGTRFTSRLAGGISAGFSYAKGNNQLQYNVNANLNSRARRHEFISSLSSTYSGEPGGIGTDRNNVNLQYWLSLTRNWLVGSYNDFLSSQEQQLDLRATFGFGLARHLARTNRTTFTVFSGAVYTNENYRQDGEERTRRRNVEGLLGARFSIFRFDSTQITAGTRIFPSLTDTGRYRIDSDIGGKIDLGHSITWNLNVYSNYDSRPPQGVPNSDAGVTFGLGWTF
jgi:putative salt-induced outer membrane protein YdiY